MERKSSSAYCFGKSLPAPEIKRSIFTLGVKPDLCRPDLHPPLGQARVDP